MSKHICKAKDWNDSGYSRNCVYLEDDLMDYLDGKLSENKEKFWLILEIIEDPYGDFKIEGENVLELKKELNQIIRDKTISNNILSVLLELIRLTDTALNKKLNLYAIAD